MPLFNSVEGLRIRIKDLENENKLLLEENKVLKEQLSALQRAGQKPLDNEETIVSIFERYLNGASLGDIAEEYNNRGIKTKRGGKWHKATVKYILQNHLYVENGYVDEKTYQEVQKIMKVNRKNKKGE